MRQSLYARVGLTLAGLTWVAAVQAGNPVIKERFSADPAAMVHDGRVYLYTGHDQAAEDGDFFVLKEWNIYSSTDLKDWNLEGAFQRTAFDWARHDSAWAAHAIERDGKFYWYVTVLNDDPENPERNGYAVGVAVSDDPVHGWEDALGEPLVRSDMTEPPASMDANQTWDDIDPAVFIDGDGQAYLYWGNTHLYYAKLKDNMIELDGGIHKVDVEGMPGTFTEAPWVHHYRDQYYLTFAMNYPEELVYATSDSPAGPWTYQGLLMDTLEDSGTSHQAVLEYEGEWYLIYHTAALPTGGNFRRAVSIEHLNYNDDGSIQKIIPTATGIHYTPYALQSDADTDHYVRYDQSAEAVASELEAEDHNSFKWHVEALQQGDNTLSFQPETRVGYYLAEQDGELQVARHDGTDEFIQSATFEQVPGLANERSASFRLVASDQYLMLDSGRLVLGSPSANERKAATFVLQAAE